MDKEKQIEEMVFALTESQHAFDRAWKECLHNNAPMPDRENVFYAKYLIEKEGYRKASDIAEEIFAELDTFIVTKVIDHGTLKYDIGDKYKALKQKYSVALPTIAELKQKYTEDGK